MKPVSLFLLGMLLVAAEGCKREKRVFDPGAAESQLANGVALNPVHAGGTASSAGAAADYAKYEDSAYAVAEGKRLFSAYNCVGCHQHGGGGVGPALMDATWIYGSHPDNIFSDIVQGRPNGMPTFGGKIPDYQIWELVAYVRSMSGQLPSDIAPSRSDEMPVAKAEQARKKEHPADENQQPIQHAPQQGEQR